MDGWLIYYIQKKWRRNTFLWTLKSQLEKLNIDLNTVIEKVLSTSKDFNNEIENINKYFKNLQDRVSKIRNAEKKIDEILGIKEKVTQKTVNKDIER